MDPIGIGGLAISGISIVFAWLRTRSSNKIAQQSNRIAESSKQKAEAANQLSAESNTIAREANRIAVDANQLAEDANTTARLRKARDEERNDVFWDGDWERPGRYVLTNTGQDEAHHVIAVVTVQDVQRTVERELVRGTEPIAFEFAEARDEFLRDKAERARRRQESRWPSPIDSIPCSFFVVEHVTWRTELGIPRTHHEEHRMSYME